MKYVSIAVVLAFIVGLAATVAYAKPNDDEPNAPHKVFVCKYVGTPGAGETLQTGQNPIEVDSHALEGDGFAGSFPFPFSDAHGKSIAIGWSGEDYPVLGIGSCPAPVQGEDPVQVEASVTAVNPVCEPDGSTIGLVFGNEDRIDYSVEGNIAPGATVGVTATAKDGFELVGQSEFEVTFAEFDPAACNPQTPGDPGGDGGEGVAGKKAAAVAPVVTAKAPSGGDLPFTL
jgi:hypothetical protein